MAENHPSSPLQRSELFGNSARAEPVPGDKSPAPPPKRPRHGLHHSDSDASTLSSTSVRLDDPENASDTDQPFFPSPPPRTASRARSRRNRPPSGLTPTHSVNNLSLAAIAKSPLALPSSNSQLDSVARGQHFSNGHSESLGFHARFKPTGSSELTDEFNVRQPVEVQTPSDGVPQHSLLRRSLVSLFSPIYTLFAANSALQTEATEDNPCPDDCEPKTCRTDTCETGARGPDKESIKPETEVSRCDSVPEVQKKSADDAAASPDTDTPESDLIPEAGDDDVAASTISSATPAVSSSADNGAPEQFDPYSFIASLPPLDRISERPPPCLPPKPLSAPKITLVLDLDETLVHASTTPLPGADIEFSVLFNDFEYKVFARKRPHMERFLSEVSKLFEIVVFTASHQIYAERLLTLLDPTNQWFQHRCYRDSCVYLAGNYLKDLTVLGRDLSKTAIIDNSPQAFGFQLDNGIPIETWTDQNEDVELLNILPLLRDIAEMEDVRSRIHTEFGSHEKVAQRKEMLHIAVRESE